MKRSANTTRKKADNSEQKQTKVKATGRKAGAPDGNAVETAAVKKKQKPKRKTIASVRRIPVQYTQRIPGAHCPGC